MNDKNLELSEKDQIKGHIYVISNLENNKQYVGQALTHRKNKGKYRVFGYNGRFNDHISEAINNTKKNQCVYLNNAIRKYGKDKFSVKLIITCDVNEMNKLEQKYISEYNTLYPNGYNLTKGGQTLESIKIENNEALKKAKKRGREFGYVHKDSTKTKIKEFFSKPEEVAKRKSKMSEMMIEFYDNKKIDILSKMDIKKDIKQYIRPVKNKDTGEIHNYIIRVGKKKLCCDTKTLSLPEKYNRLEKLLNSAYEKKQATK